MKQMQIGLIGCGTVGEGVARILLNHQEKLKKRLGTKLVLKKIADLNTSVKEKLALDDDIFTTETEDILKDPEIDLIVEMVGGLDFPGELIKKAIESGKHIVTANKKLLALKGNELFLKASEKNIKIGYEASVGGCMPIIKTIRENLVANNITAMRGILNGTCNYILSEISRLGISFDEALLTAQKKGFAEADPRLDIEGLDTAHKLCIISALAYGTKMNFDSIYVEGISHIKPIDITYANQFGYCIKLLAISKNHGDKIEARVHPTMIPLENPLSQVKGSLNAISIYGDLVDEMMLYGHGAGMMPTASAVLADIVDIARSLEGEDKGGVPGLGYRIEDIRDIPVMPISEITSHYYFRVSAADRPGVLSKVSGILGKYNISIMSVHQKKRHISNGVPLVFMTHKAKEADMRKALEEIKALSEVKEEVVLIRIEDTIEEE